MEWIKTNGTIDLYKQTSGLYGKYNIFLHNTNTHIGVICLESIKVYNEKNELFENNIWYNIFEIYQGNSYAFQSLLLLVDYLASEHVQNITISALKDNYSSVRTIEKFKSRLEDSKVYQNHSSANIVSYKIKLLEK